mmetsp:Transcript_5867/g.17057  ORF Transcript_5867/g.17057 Transcript_5867/m.17057 type:complete len:211 (-) Transcript_5867:3-635(-)
MAIVTDGGLPAGVVDPFHGDARGDLQWPEVRKANFLQAGDHPRPHAPVEQRVVVPDLGVERLLASDAHLLAVHGRPLQVADLRSVWEFEVRELRPRKVEGDAIVHFEALVGAHGAVSLRPVCPPHLDRKGWQVVIPTIDAVGELPRGSCDLHVLLRRSRALKGGTHDAHCGGAGGLRDLSSNRPRFATIRHGRHCSRKLANELWSRAKPA